MKQIKDEKKMGVLLAYVNIVTTNLVNLFYIPILLRQLGTEEYGLFSLCSALVEYLAVINLGYGNAYVKYYSQFREEEKKDKIKSLNGIMLGIYILLGTLVILSGILLIFNINVVLGNNFETKDYILAAKLIFLLTLNLAVTFPNGVFGAMISTHEKFIFHKSMEIFRGTAVPVIGMAFLLNGFHSLAIAAIMFSVTSIAFIMNCTYCLYVLKIRFSFKNIQWNLVKDIFRFSFFLLLQSIADCMNWQVDKLILARTAGSIAIAYYTVGAKINAMMMSFSGAIHGVFIPKINRLVAKDKYHRDISELFAKVARIQFMIVAYIYLGFVIVGEEFVRIWAGSEYHNAYLVAVLLAFPLLIQTPMQMGIIVLRAQNKNGLLNVFFLGICIVNVLVSIPLSRQYGEIGAAFGSCVSLIIAWSIITLVFFEQSGKMNMKYIMKEVYKLGKGMILPFFTVFGISKRFYWTGLKGIIVYGLLFTIFYWGIVYYFYMQDEEKEMVKRCLPFLR